MKNTVIAEPITDNNFINNNYNNFINNDYKNYAVNDDKEHL